MSQRFSFRSLRRIALLVLLAFLAAPRIMAQTFDDKAALTGLTEVKVAFDITTGEGKGLLSRLNIIDETRQSLIQQGVQPYFVLAFRGPATKLVQTDQEKIKPEDREGAAKVAARIKQLSKAPGIEGFEQCAVASRTQETKT